MEEKEQLECINKYLLTMFHFLFLLFLGLPSVMERDLALGQKLWGQVFIPSQTEVQQ